MKKSCDVLIVGAGIIGLSIARELSRRGTKNIVVLEKENALGAHASGRNSGVLHAGLYYATDSLKALFCSSGAKQMKEFAATHGIPVHQTGKVLLASDEKQRPALEALWQRATQNGIRVEKISVERLREMEPAARTVGFALFSPDTSVIDPHHVMNALGKELVDSNIHIAFSEPVLGIQSRHKVVRTPLSEWSYGHLVNAAGLQADRLAHAMGVGLEYRILPFRGRYKKLKAEASSRIHGLIYPVPDSRLPFLGVHLTKATSGDVWVGPTAEPALGREHYEGAKGIVWSELPQIVADLFSMTLRNASGLASHIQDEIKKKLPGGLLTAAQRLVPSLEAKDFSEETKTGLRAQLIDVRHSRLVMDFVVEKGPASTHILNAVSPGFTASFAFAEYVADFLRGAA
jgi:L-2-hydroxyglutarate oxidase LhgO